MQAVLQQHQVLGRTQLGRRAARHQPAHQRLLGHVHRHHHQQRAQQQHEPGAQPTTGAVVQAADPARPEEQRGGEAGDAAAPQLDRVDLLQRGAAAGVYGRHPRTDGRRHRASIGFGLLVATRAPVLYPSCGA